MKRLFAFLISVSLFGAGCSVGQGLPGETSVPQETQAKLQEPTSGATLDLSGRGLASIPMDVFSRTELTGLDLSDNRLTGAPQSQIGQLKNLKVLDLSNNALTGLPAELGQLDKLEMLYVSNNKLTGLPMEIGNLTRLRVLDITGNEYSSRDLDEIAKKLTNTRILR